MVLGPLMKGPLKPISMPLSFGQYKIDNRMGWQPFSVWKSPSLILFWRDLPESVLCSVCSFEAMSPGHASVGGAKVYKLAIQHCWNNQYQSPNTKMVSFWVFIQNFPQSPRPLATNQNEPDESDCQIAAGNRQVIKETWLWIMMLW